MDLPPFHDVILSAIWKNSQNGAICFKSAENRWPDVPYAELYNAILSCAKTFRQLGIKKNDVVTIALHNTWHYFPCYFGAACVGAISSGMSPEYTPFEMSYQLFNSETKVLLISSSLLPKIAKLIKELPKLEIILYLGAVPSCEQFSPIKLINFKSILAEEPVFDRTALKVNVKDDIFGLPYSSGTTGLPKGVMITHFNMLSHMLFLSQHYAVHVTPIFPELAGESMKVTVSFLPYYHAYGFTAVCGHLLGGTTVVIMEHFNYESLLGCVQEYKIGHLSMVPMLFNYLVHSPLVDRYDLSSIKSLSCGGAPLSSHMIEQVKKRLPSLLFVMQGYGMTEMVSASHMTVFDEPTPPNAIGKLIDGMQHKVVDPETGKVLPPGEVGEICVKGPTVMKGYWRNDGENAMAIDGDGFLRTGDVGYIDEHDFLYLKDRFKELIKVKAFQVAPAELEHLLLTHPEISDAAVIGIPHETVGEAPRAFIVPNSPSLTAQEVLDFVKERVSSYKQLIGGVQFVGQTPNQSRLPQIFGFQLQVLNPTKTPVQNVKHFFCRNSWRETWRSFCLILSSRNLLSIFYPNFINFSSWIHQLYNSLFPIICRRIQK
uniref:Luciferase n=1 Tax=Panagrolaimus sp. JU765 TaxID=591449 RepID=A0AC34QY29_9BILA